MPTSLPVAAVLLALEAQLASEAWSLPEVWRVGCLASRARTDPSYPHFVVVLYNPANDAALSLLRSFEAAGGTAKVQIRPLEARTPQEIEAAVVLAARERAEALVWVVDSPLILQQAQIAELGASHRLPPLAGHPSYPDVGGLIGYGPNRKDLSKRVAIYLDKIFNGADPREVPLQQPAKLDLVINRKTAKALGLTIPSELVLLADRVIE